MATRKTKPPITGRDVVSATQTRSGREAEKSRCSRLGADEGALLRLVSLLQYDRVCLATMILADWLQPTAARMAMLPARGLAEALAHGGLAIPLRHGRVDVALSSPPPRVDPGFALVQ